MVHRNITMLSSIGGFACSSGSIMKSNIWLELNSNGTTLCSSSQYASAPMALGLRCVAKFKSVHPFLETISLFTDFPYFPELYFNPFFIFAFEVSFSLSSFLSFLVHEVFSVSIVHSDPSSVLFWLLLTYLLVLSVSFLYIWHIFVHYRLF